MAGDLYCVNNFKITSFSSIFNYFLIQLIASFFSQESRKTGDLCDMKKSVASKKIKGIYVYTQAFTPHSRAIDAISI